MSTRKQKQEKRIDSDRAMKTKQAKIKTEIQTTEYILGFVYLKTVF